MFPRRLPVAGQCRSCIWLVLDLIHAQPHISGRGWGREGGREGERGTAYVKSDEKHTIECLESGNRE